MELIYWHQVLHILYEQFTDIVVKKYDNSHILSYFMMKYSQANMYHLIKSASQSLFFTNLAADRAER